MLPDLQKTTNMYRLFTALRNRTNRRPQRTHEEAPRPAAARGDAARLFRADAAGAEVHPRPEGPAPRHQVPQHFHHRIWDHQARRCKGLDGARCLTPAPASGPPLCASLTWLGSAHDRLTYAELVPRSTTSARLPHNASRSLGFQRCWVAPQRWQRRPLGRLTTCRLRFVRGGNTATK